MAYTSHGHHIPNTTMGDVNTKPDATRCGGPKICPRCKAEVESSMAYNVGEKVDYQAKAKRMVKDYVDSLHKQNYPLTELPTYEVYVIWFAKTLQNWKASLGTTMPDDMLFELTFDGDKKIVYFNVYKKHDSFQYHERG